MGIAARQENDQTSLMQMPIIDRRDIGVDLCQHLSRIKQMLSRQPDRDLCCQ